MPRFDVVAVGQFGRRRRAAICSLVHAALASDLSHSDLLDPLLGGLRFAQLDHVVNVCPGSVDLIRVEASPGLDEVLNLGDRILTRPHIAASGLKFRAAACL